MSEFRRRWLWIVLVLVICPASGCRILEETHKWNRQAPLDEGDAYFSISDPVAEAMSAD